MISNEAIDEYYEVYNNEYYKNIVYDIINNCKHEKNDGNYENYENEYIDYKIMRIVVILFIIKIWK